MIGGGLAAAVSLLRVEFDVDVYEKAPQLNEVSGDIRGGVPWRRAREIVAEPMVCGLTAGGRWIRSYGGLRLPKKPKDSAIPGVAIKKVLSPVLSPSRDRVYPGSDPRESPRL